MKSSMMQLFHAQIAGSVLEVVLYVITNHLTSLIIGVERYGMVLSKVQRVEL